MNYSDLETPVSTPETQHPQIPPPVSPHSKTLRSVDDRLNEASTDLDDLLRSLELSPEDAALLLSNQKYRAHRQLRTSLIAQQLQLAAQDHAKSALLKLVTLSNCNNPAIARLAASQVLAYAGFPTPRPPPSPSPRIPNATPSQKPPPSPPTNSKTPEIPTPQSSNSQPSEIPNLKFSNSQIPEISNLKSPSTVTSSAPSKDPSPPIQPPKSKFKNPFSPLVPQCLCALVPLLFSLLTLTSPASNSEPLMKLPQLLSHLHAAGLQTLTLSHGTGTVIITPHGGRILGIFTHPDADNAFWLNPELQSPATAAKFLAGEHVLGGDRLWLAPERGLFFKGDSLADGVVTQPSIDPGNWHVGRLTDRSVRLTNNINAAWLRTPNAIVRGTVERSIRRIANPFLHAPDALPNLAATQYAGYEIASTFTLHESPQDSLHIGMWFLIQLVVPHGGYLYAPTAGTAVVTGDYYEPTGPDYLRVTENHVRFKLDSLARHKIGIRKTEVLGRAAFLSNADPATHNATLVIRNFLNNPSGHYSDVPLHTPEGTQDSIQSYNHNSGPSGFGELEYHTPGINRAMPEPVITDTTQLWTFTGTRNNLVPIAAKLLNLPETVFSV